MEQIDVILRLRYLRIKARVVAVQEVSAPDAGVRHHDVAVGMGAFPQVVRDTTQEGNGEYDYGTHSDPASVHSPSSCSVVTPSAAPSASTTGLLR